MDRPLISYVGALKMAETCFRQVAESPNLSSMSEAKANRLQALAEAGKGFVMLAQEIRLAQKS